MPLSIGYISYSVISVAVSVPKSSAVILKRLVLSAMLDFKIIAVPLTVPANHALPLQSNV